MFEKILEIWLIACMVFIGVMLIVFIGPEVTKYLFWWGNYAAIAIAVILFVSAFAMLIKFIVRTIQEHRRENYYMPGEWTRKR